MDECRIGGNTGAAGNAGWMRFATRGMRRALVHVPMMVPAMTVPFLSSMVTDSWLSFWRNLTSFIFALPVPRPCGTFLPGDGLPLRIYPRGGVRAVEVARVESTNDPCVSARCRLACGLARDAARVCVSRAFSGSRLKLSVGFSQSQSLGSLAGAHDSSAQPGHHSFSSASPRTHNEEHEGGTRGGSCEGRFGASRVER